MVLLENYAAHHQRWARCFNDPTMSDVVFEAKDGQTFHCEKFVLEVASPYFKKLFARKNCGDSPKFIAARDVEPEALKWILRACYTGDGEVDDKNVVSVMVAAGTYGMEWVEKACMKYLRGNEGEPLAAFEYSIANEKWQEWRVPESGWYHIAALGAKAADQANTGQLNWAKGGMGAMMGGSFELQAGDALQILTGGMSKLWISDKYRNRYSGGGGGSFVALKQDKLSLLLAAGGGGSADLAWYGQDGSLGENGVSAHSSCQGGKNGGNGGNNLPVGVGGLGWKAGPTALATRRTDHPGNNGGFGGGGGGDGGGGGYSGGSAGCNTGAGGGGSYVAPQAANVWKKAGCLGHGKVFIWKGKDVPLDEKSFLKDIGDPGSISKITESIQSWEILE